MHETRTCELSPKCMKIYKELEKDFLAEVNDGSISVDNALTKMLRLSQLTSGYVQLDPERIGLDSTKYEIIDNNKIDLLKDILLDIDIDEPVVVFCNFRNEINRIREMAEKSKRTSGELSGKENNLAEWQQGKTSLLVVQIQSGGVGIDLTRSRYCMYFSTGNSLFNFQQSQARVHRPGQLRKVYYIYLVAKGTVDMTIAKAMQNKQNLSELFLQNRFEV